MADEALKRANEALSLVEETPSPAARLDIALERDMFLRNLIRELAGTLEDVVGLEEASGYISLVGAKIGELINDTYKQGYGTARLDQTQVKDVLVDLKARIQGDFRLESMDSEKMVFVNKACPFAEKVLDRTSMCMMTSNVFGYIAAENLGYAKVDLQETIAARASRCRVVVHLKRSPEAESCDGREYYGETDDG